MTAEEIADFARAKKPLPHGVNLAEKQLYTVLRGIYRSYAAKELTLDEAKLAKKDAIREFESEQLAYEVYQDNVRKTSEMAKVSAQCEKCEKCGCEYCKQIARIFDGRQRRAFI